MCETILLKYNLPYIRTSVKTNVTEIKVQGEKKNNKIFPFFNQFSLTINFLTNNKVKLRKGEIL